jgi:hypothetical protein
MLEPRNARSAPDAVLVAAVDLARAAAVDVGEDSVGEHLGAYAAGDRIVSHTFATTLPGYVGWHWAVTLARAPRSKSITVDEVVLLPARVRCSRRNGCRGASGCALVTSGPAISSLPYRTTRASCPRTPNRTTPTRQTIPAVPRRNAPSPSSWASGASA